MEKKLLDYVEPSDSNTSLEEAVSTITELAKKNNEERSQAFLSSLNELVSYGEGVVDALKETADLLKRVAERPLPKEFPSEIALSRPEWWKDAPQIDYEMLAACVAQQLAPLLLGLTERIGSEHIATRGVLSDILNKEVETAPIIEEEAKEEEKKTGKFPLNVGSIRRKARWEVAFIPSVAGKASITSAGDGLTFYLPGAPITNSETVRLNGGLPLSSGIDYTLTGNKIVFAQDQTASQIEVRYQN